LRDRLAVLASGRGSNLGAILDAIDAGSLDARVVLVLSDQPAAPALERARSRGIPTAVVRRRDFPDAREFNLALAQRVEQAQAEWVVLAGYMRILHPDFLERFAGHVVNIHPALLPAFPGLHGQRQALEHGVKLSGCTVHFVDAGVDTGPIIAQVAVEVLPDDTEDELSARILREEHRLYPRVLGWLVSGRVVCQGRVVRVLPAGEGTR
jgi:phosphoribosylglycinamide formyltransferase-1